MGGPLKRRCYSGQPARTNWALTGFIVSRCPCLVEVVLTPIYQINASSSTGSFNGLWWRAGLMPHAQTMLRAVLARHARP